MTKRPKMTKNQYPSLNQYRYHRYIFISRPPPRGEDRQKYILSIERIISISHTHTGRGEQTDRQFISVYISFILISKFKFIPKYISFNKRKIDK